jgi:hypothetical protein
MPWLRRALPIAVLVAVAGCVSVDATLEADGSGTIEMTYHLPPNATEASERTRFSSDHVKVESLAFRPDGTANVKARVDDATKLSTTPLFRDTTVTRERDGQDEILKVHMVNRNPTELKDETKEGPTIRISLPGKVVEANEGATVSGNTVTWKFSLASYMRRASINLSVRYAAPAAASPTTRPGADAPR